VSHECLHCGQVVIVPNYSRYFICVGFFRVGKYGVGYRFVVDGNTIDLCPRHLSYPHGFLKLAPLDFWLKHYPYRRKEKNHGKYPIDWALARNHLIGELFQGGWL